MSIRFDRVSKSFGAVTALQDVSFRARRGEITGFVGRNGAGKSTALRVLLGLIAPDSGRATLDDRSIAALPPTAVGAMLEASAHPSCRARNQVAIRATRLGLPTRHVDSALELTGASAFAHRKIGKLSLGQKQRVGLATALLGTPRLIVLDEPANGLDPDGVLWLRAHLRTVADAGATVLVSSHVLSELDRLVDAVVVIQQSIRWSGDLSDMRRQGLDSIEELFASVAPESVMAS